MMQILFILLANLCFAAPHPGMGSSLLGQKNLGVYLSKEGIQFKAAHQLWRLDLTDSFIDELKTPFRLLSTQSPSATISFSSDKLKKTQNISTYVKHWVKEYQYFGFEILKTTPTSIFGEKGYVIDLIHRKNQKQVRQFLAVRNSRSILMTCTDSIADFSNTIKQCHEIYKSLQWSDNLNKAFTP